MPLPPHGWGRSDGTDYADADRGKEGDMADLTFVIMVHDAKSFGDTPAFKFTCVEKQFMTHSGGMKIIQGLHEKLKDALGISKFAPTTHKPDDSGSFM